MAFDQSKVCWQVQVISGILPSEEGNKYEITLTLTFDL